MATRIIYADYTEFTQYTLTGFRRVRFDLEIERSTDHIFTTETAEIAEVTQRMLQRSTMFIAWLAKHCALQRSAICLAGPSYIPLLTERLNGERRRYKHFAPPEQRQGRDWDKDATASELLLLIQDLLPQGCQSPTLGSN